MVDEEVGTAGSFRLLTLPIVVVSTAPAAAPTVELLVTSWLPAVVGRIPTVTKVPSLARGEKKRGDKREISLLLLHRGSDRFFVSGSHLVLVLLVAPSIRRSFLMPVACPARVG